MAIVLPIPTPETSRLAVPEQVYPIPLPTEISKPNTIPIYSYPYPYLSAIGIHTQDMLFNGRRDRILPPYGGVMDVLRQVRPDLYRPLDQGLREVTNEALDLIDPEEKWVKRNFHPEVSLVPGAGQKNTLNKVSWLVADGWADMDEVNEFIAMPAAVSLSERHRVLKEDDSEFADDMRVVAATPFHLDGESPACILTSRMDAIEMSWDESEVEVGKVANALFDVFRGKKKRANMLDVAELDRTDITIGKREYSSLEVLQRAIRYLDEGKLKMRIYELKCALNGQQKSIDQLGQQLGANMLSYLRLAENAVPELSDPELMDTFWRKIGASALILGCKIVPDIINIAGHPDIDELVPPTNIYVKKVDFTTSQMAGYMQYHAGLVRDHLEAEKANNPLRRVA